MIVEIRTMDCNLDWTRLWLVMVTVMVGHGHGYGRSRSRLWLVMVTAMVGYGYGWSWDMYFLFGKYMCVHVHDTISDA